MEEMKKVIELNDYTVEAIRNAQRMLASDKRFKWIRKLDVDGFLAVLFSTADISIVMRKTLAEMFGEGLPPIPEPELPNPKEPKGYYTPLEGKILKVLYKYRIPLLPSQISSLTGIKVGTIDAIVERMRKRGIIEHVPKCGWKINLDEIKYWAEREPVTDRVYRLLKEARKPLSSEEIARELGLFRKEVTGATCNLHRRGLIDYVKKGVYRVKE